MRNEIEAAREGDLPAFARLVETHHGSVCAITTAILGDPVAGEDAAQEAFLVGWRKLRQLDDPRRFSAWLHQIARNTARMHHRSARRRPDAVSAAPVDAAGSAASAEEALADAEVTTVVAAAVAELPEDVREVLVLYYREGRSTAEVATQLALSEAAVRKRLSRARERLKADVEERFGGWMERTRPRAGFVAAVLVAIGIAGLPARAEAKPIPWRLGGSLALGASAALALAVWMSPATEGRSAPAPSSSIEGVASAPLPPATHRAAEAAGVAPEAPAPYVPASPTAEALIALAAAGAQRVIQCDVTQLGVAPAEIVDGLGSAFPPAVDVTNGILTFITGPADGTYLGATFGDGTLAMNLGTPGPDGITPCSIAVAPPFEDLEIPEVVTMDMLGEGILLGLDKEAEHAEGVSPLHLALEDDRLSPAAHQLLEGWLAKQAVEAERELLRAQMLIDNPGLTITLTPATAP